MYTQEEIQSLVSQIEGLSSKRPMFYMKFCRERRFAENILDGNLFANTPAYFREQELRSGIRGQGDKNELTLSFIADRIRAFDRETGNLAFTTPAATIRIRFNDDEKIPLVSFVGIPLHDMKFITADEKHAEFEFPFTEKEFSEMQDSFGPYCVLIGARELETRIEQACSSKGVDYLFDPVMYVPSNSLEKLRCYQTGAKERFLYKDEDLSYQREYRLALGIEIPEDHFIRIGKLETATILSSATLKDLRFAVEYTSYSKEK